MLHRLSNENVRDNVSVRLQADLKEPGFFAKRRRDRRPANDVLAGLPFGPVIDHGLAEADHGPAEAGHDVRGDHAAVS